MSIFGYSAQILTLCFSLFILLAEDGIRFVTSILPGFVIDIFTFFAGGVLGSEEQISDKAKKISEAFDFGELCSLFGYDYEEHIVLTRDGYLLGVHRIVGRTTEEPRPPNQRDKPIAYLHHGLLMSSEVWITNLDPKRSLAFQLADWGYDVWLGNNRGNKYSRKHIAYDSNSTRFWTFSIDDFALYDIPDTIDYILRNTGKPSLTYIGFSQGTAQAFAALSIYPPLNSRINALLAIAPALAPAGLVNRIVDALVKASPTVLYSLFGRRAILPSAIFWQNIMYPPMFVKIIDLCLIVLFNWRSHYISYQQRVASFFHLYSYTSVKAVVHWFQIMRSGYFQMYDDDNSVGVFLRRNGVKVAVFPTNNISTPIYILYGQSDSLIDIDAMLASLPPHSSAKGVPFHEHLDLLWGDDTDQHTIPFVKAALYRLHGELTKELLADVSQDESEESVTVVDTSGDRYPIETEIRRRLSIDDIGGILVGSSAATVSVSKQNA